MLWDMFNKFLFLFMDFEMLLFYSIVASSILVLSLNSYRGRLINEVELKGLSNKVLGMLAQYSIQDNQFTSRFRKFVFRASLFTLIVFALDSSIAMFRYGNAGLQDTWFYVTIPILLLVSLLASRLNAETSLEEAKKSSNFLVKLIALAFTVSLWGVLMVLKFITFSASASSSQEAEPDNIFGDNALDGGQQRFFYSRESDPTGVHDVMKFRDTFINRD